MDGERNTRTGGNDGVGMEQKIAAALKRNRVPYVFGMPFSMFWVVFWIGVEFFGVIGFFLYEHGREAR